MSRSIKLKFDKDCEFTAKYVAVTKNVIGGQYVESGLGDVVFDNKCRVISNIDGFDFTAEDIEELHVTLTPLDSVMIKVSFKVKKIDDSIKTLPINMYGCRGSNIFLSFENEISGSEELPDN